MEALRRLCGYASTRGAIADKGAGGELVCAEAEPPPLPEQPTLHQLLIREKADFEAKVQRAVSRKKWLKGKKRPKQHHHYPSNQPNTNCDGRQTEA